MVTPSFPSSNYPLWVFYCYPAKEGLLSTAFIMLFIVSIIVRDLFTGFRGLLPGPEKNLPVPHTRGGGGRTHTHTQVWAHIPSSTHTYDQPMPTTLKALHNNSKESATHTTQHVAPPQPSDGIPPPH